MKCLKVRNGRASTTARSMATYILSMTVAPSRATGARPPVKPGVELHGKADGSVPALRVG